MKDRFGFYVMVFMVVALAVAFVSLTAASGQTVPEENQVGFWCDGDNGVKYEPVTTPFHVPEPPEGTIWTLIVLKGGTTNETWSYPDVGGWYSHSLHANSHVILCWEALVITTTTEVTTTTIPTTTTSSTTTTVLTETTSSTSTSIPGSSTTTTLGTTTTSLPGSTSLPPSTTVPPTTTIPEIVTDLPETGAPLMPFAIAGMALLLTGGLAVNRLKAER